MTPADEWDTSTDPRRLLDLLGPNLTLRRARLFAAGYLRWDHEAHHRLTGMELKWVGFYEQAAIERKGQTEWEKLRRIVPYPTKPVLDRAAGFGQFGDEANDSDVNLRDGVPALFHQHVIAQAATAVGPPPSDIGPGHSWHGAFQAVYEQVIRPVTALVRCVFPNPYRPVAFDPRWRTDTAVGVAGQMFDAREFSAMPILADALQDAGCEDAAVLGHCRGPGPHARGCWVVDAVLARG